jgi:hypothetical protein
MIPLGVPWGIISQKVGDLVVKRLQYVHYGEVIYSMLSEALPDFEFFMSPREFVKFTLANAHLLCTTGKPFLLTTTVKNPTTGSVFNIIAGNDQYVGSIRFFFYNDKGTTALAFRFRIEARNTPHANIREEAEKVTSQTEICLAAAAIELEFNEPQSSVVPITLYEGN